MRGSVPAAEVPLILRGRPNDMPRHGAERRDAGAACRRDARRQKGMVAYIATTVPTGMLVPVEPIEE